MRAPSKRVTFVVAFLVANFLLFFPFASEAHEVLPGSGEAGADELEVVPDPALEEDPADDAVPEDLEEDGTEEGELR